jgi:hypothetical protein
MSPIVSLQERRLQQQKLIAHRAMPLEDRVSDLEADLLRVIDASLDLEKQLDVQRRYVSKLLKLLKKSL